MNPIRIGNDINVTWGVYSRNGMKYSLEGKELSLWILSGPYKKKLDGFSVQMRNEITFSLDAKELTRYGIYRLLLRIKDDVAIADDASYDLTVMFQIVSQSYPNPVKEAIDGAVDLSFQSILNNVIVSTLEGASAYEIAVKHGYTGTEEEWLADISGKSAYLYAVEHGYTGTEEEFAEAQALVVDSVAKSQQALDAAQEAEGKVGTAETAAANAATAAARAADGAEQAAATLAGLAQTLQEASVDESVISVAEVAAKVEANSLTPAGRAYNGTMLSGKVLRRAIDGEPAGVYDNEGYATSELFPVTPGQIILYTGTVVSQNYQGLFFYGKDMKTTVPALMALRGPQLNLRNRPVTVPNGIYYARFCSRNVSGTSSDTDYTGDYRVSILDTTEADNYRIASKGMTPAEFRLDSDTELVSDENERLVGAGAWLLRFQNEYNSVSKESTYFHIVLSAIGESSYPALWCLNSTMLKSLLGKALIIRFKHRGDSVKFVANTSVVNGYDTGSSEGWTDHELRLVLGTQYADARVGFYNNAPGYQDSSIAFDICDFSFELQNMIPELSSKLFDASGGLASNVRSVNPLLTYSYIQKNGMFDGYDSGLRAISTPRYIKVGGGTVHVSVQQSCYIGLRKYDENFATIRNNITETFTPISAASGIDYKLEDNCRFIKIVLCSTTVISDTSAPRIPMQDITVSGNIPADWDTFNERPSDDGYHTLIARPNVTNPTCCDNTNYPEGEPAVVQDSEEILVDYGVICLPPRYKNIGEPTRLIIYCHGAAVNYQALVNRFNTQDLEPEYWLAEGYAVMDVEGNPFDNTNEHFSIPQSVDCYVAAYKWAIQHYNLKRDGVFLGGRSMGGAMTFSLLKVQNMIPIIAACPNVPHSMCMGGAKPNATIHARQRFYATHCGFDIPEGFDWSTIYQTGDIEDTSSKKWLFYHNWDKLIKNTPIFGLCTDLPTDEESKKKIIDNFFTASEKYPNDRVAIWSKLHTVARCPVKLFGCYEDETCPPAETSALFYRMLLNAGQTTELRLFHSYQDYSDMGTTAHHYDTQDPALRTDVTTRYGEQLTNIPIVYVEMLQFWRRYEQGN